MAGEPQSASAHQMQTDEARPTRPVRSHRFLVGTLVTLATIVGVVAVLAVWTNRQVLNTDNWTHTSSQLLANKQIQTALSAYLVTELFKTVNVEAELKSKLPKQLEGLAAPVAGGVQQLAGQAVPVIIASPQAQDAWTRANRLASTQLLKIVNGGGKVVSTNGGVVTLNVHALVAQLAATFGISQQQLAAVQSKAKGVAATARQKGLTLPPSSGQIVILRSNQLKTVQDVAGALKDLAIVLPLVALALFALSVGLARGRRRQALRMTGWCIFGIGLLALIVRRVIGNEIVDSLVKHASNKAAAHEVWNIGTSLLYDIAVALVVLGLVVVVAAWIAGRTGPATGLRRMLAPSLREHPVLSYAFAGLAYLLLLLWGPTPAFRQPIPIIVFAILLAGGVEALRRETAKDFPTARRGDTARAMRDWYAARRQPHAPAAPSDPTHVAELERLATLHDRGALTAAEYEHEKATLINGTS